MLSLKFVIYFLFLSCSINKTNKAYPQSQFDSVFINWNKSTFESLNRQSRLATDSMQKALYVNRIVSVKEYLKIKSIDDLNVESIRYKFLETLFANRQQKDFYIIEANESGSKVLLRSYVLNMTSNNTSDVEFYSFVNGEWNKTGKFKQDNFYRIGDLKQYISKFGKGFNYDDIVITKFENGNIKESEYYLYSTLSAESKIKSILDGYRKENFTK